MEGQGQNILIMGIGNEVLTDDEIGPKIAKELGRQIKDPGIRFESVALGGLEIIELFRGFEKVVIIDAIKTRDGIPGALYLFRPDDFKETLHLSNLHDVNFLVALELAEQLGIKLTSEIYILAVEIIEDLVFSEEFTPELAKAFPGILVEIKEFLYNELNISEFKTVESKA